jgi:hypothetical protein
MTVFADPDAFDVRHHSRNGVCALL